MSTKADLHFMQDYEIITVHRSQIKEADYNPRVINEQNMKDLKKSMRKIKLREPLIWNKLTGNLVGGHQRLKVLDDEWKKKYKNLDYSLTVAAVQLDKKQEIELNIALNNPRLMGDYSIEKMNEILSSGDFPEIDFDIAGIKDDDLQAFGIYNDIGNIQNEEADQMMQEYEEIKKADSEKVSNEDKEERKKAVKDVKQGVVKNEVDTYVTISFSNQSEKHQFMRLIGEPEDQLFLKGEIFVKKHFKSE